VAAGAGRSVRLRIFLFAFKIPNTRGRGSRGVGGLPIRFGQEVRGGPDGWGPPVGEWRRERGARCWVRLGLRAGELGRAAQVAEREREERGRGLGRWAEGKPAQEEGVAHFLFQKEIDSPIFVLVSKLKQAQANKIKQN